MRRLSKSSIRTNFEPTEDLTFSSQVMISEFKPLMVEWDLRMPPDSSIRKWRRAQVARYLDKFPDHKPKRIMLWLASHRQNPWPDVKSYTLCRMMNEIKNSWKYPADFAGHIGIAEKVSTVTIETVSFLWDMKRPYNVEV